MKIQITFDSWEELLAFKGEAKKKSSFEKAQDRLKAIANEAETEAKTEEPKAADPVKEDPKPEEVMPEPVEAEPDPVPEPAPAPEIQLTDMQKAVRELVKAKGKDVAKDVLAKFGAKGASSLKPEDYPAALAALKEALNG
jgi:hypothetical protein